MLSKMFTVLATGGICFAFVDAAKPSIDVSVNSCFLLDAGNVDVIVKRFACLHASNLTTLRDRFSSIVSMGVLRN